MDAQLLRVERPPPPEERGSVWNLVLPEMGAPEAPPSAPGIGAVVLDAQGRVVSIDGHASRILGSPPGRIVGRTLRELFGPEGERRGLERMRAVGGGSGDTFEDVLRRPGGDRTVVSTWRPLTDAGGAPAGFDVAFMDVTPERASREALARSEERTRRFVDRLHAAVLVLSREGKVLFANATADALLGVTQGELAGRVIPAPDWTVLRDDGSPMPPSEQPLPRALGARAPVEDAIVGLRRPGEGRTAWFLVSVFPEAGGGEGEETALVTFVDVTRLRDAEEELRRSERKFRLLHESMRDAFVRTDMSGRILDFNTAYLELLGYDAEELRRLTYVDLTPPAWHEMEDRIVREQIVPLGYSDVYEKEYRRRDGRVIPVELRTFLVRDDDGAPEAMWAIVRDLTERRRAEEALRRSEDDFRYIFERSIVGKAIAKPAGELRVNEAFARMLGYEREELAGKTWQEITHPDDFALSSRWVAAMLAGERDSARFTKRYLRKDGTHVWADVSTSLRRDASGAPLYFLTGVVDITERVRAEEALRRSEEELRLATDAARLGVFRLDVPGGRLGADDRARALLGLEAPEVDVSRLLARVHPDDAARVRDVLAPGARRDGERADVEFRLAGPGGETTWLAACARFHAAGEGAAGRAVSAVGTLQDVTERRRVEAALVQSQKLEALGTLAGSVAHDFNNILLAVRGNAALAALDLPAAHAVRPCVEEIEKAGRRGADLVRQILAFARPGPPVRRATVLADLVGEAWTFLRTIVPPLVDLRLELRAPRAEASVDASALNQALVNLVKNAAEAIAPRAGVIRVVLETVDLGEDDGARLPGLPAGRYVRLAVVDDGPGMDAATLRRVFDPFFTTKAPEKGTGLGLSIVHSIMTSHSGACSIESEPGLGTTASLWLHSLDGGAAAARVPAGLPEARRAAGRILFVDDDEALVFLARRSLARLGHHVTAYADPCAALEEFRRDPSRFDVAISDVSMPRMSGYDLTRGLLAVRPDLPVILTSGFLRPEDGDAARLCGARTVVLKADSVEEMAGTIDRLLGELGAPGRPVSRG